MNKMPSFHVMCWLTAVLLVCAAMAAPEGLGLSRLKPCGEEAGACKEYFYCSDGSCHNCSNVCSPPSPNSSDGGYNFDSKICESQCQDYIHDQVKHYVNYPEVMHMLTENRREMLETIDGLRTMVVISLTLSLLVGVAMLAGLGFAWLKCRRVKHEADREKQITEKKMSSISTLTNTMGNNNKTQSELQTTGAPSVVTTTTPISARHPSEDTILEGYAYDNPGMTPSPELTDSRGESRF